MRQSVITLSILLLIACSFCSCTFHSPGSINITNDVDGKSRIVDFAYGEKKSIHILGIGGNKSHSLVNDAHRQMTLLKPLREGQYYHNLTLETRKAYFGIGMVTSVLVTADIAQKDSGNISRYTPGFLLFSPMHVSGKNRYSRVEKVLIYRHGAIVHGELTNRKGKLYKVAYHHPHTKSFRYKLLPRNHVFLFSPVPADVRADQPVIGSKVLGVRFGYEGERIEEGELIAWNNKYVIIKNSNGAYFVSSWARTKPIK